MDGGSRLVVVVVTLVVRGDGAISTPSDGLAASVAWPPTATLAAIHVPELPTGENTERTEVATSRIWGDECSVELR